MSGDEVEKREYRKHSRRSVLKKAASSSLVGVTCGVPALTDRVAAECYDSYCEEEQALRRTVEDSYKAPDDPYCSEGQVRTYLSGTMAYRFSSKTDAGNWEHYYVEAVEGKHQYRDGCSGSWTTNSGIDYQEAHIATNNDNISQFTPDGGPGLGANPNPDYDGEYNYSDAAFTVLKAALAKSNPYADAAVLAAETLDAMYSAPRDTYNNARTYTWDYDDYPKKAHHHVQFQQINYDNDTGSCTVWQRMYGGTEHNTYAIIKWTVEVEGSSETGSLSGEERSPSTSTTTVDERGGPNHPSGLDENHVIKRKTTWKKTDNRSVGPITIPSEQIPESSPLAKRDSGDGVEVYRFPTRVKATAYTGYVDE